MVLPSAYRVPLRRPEPTDRFSNRDVSAGPAGEAPDSPKAPPKGDKPPMNRGVYPEVYPEVYPGVAGLSGGRRRG